METATIIYSSLVPALILLLSGLMVKEGQVGALESDFFPGPVASVELSQWFRFEHAVLQDVECWAVTEFLAGSGIGEGDIVSLFETSFDLGGDGPFITLGRVDVPFTGYMGEVGPMIKRTRRWVVYPLTPIRGGVWSHYDSSVYLLVPIKWARLGVFGRFRHWVTSYYLPDEDPPRSRVERPTVLGVPATLPPTPTGPVDIGEIGRAVTRFAARDWF